MRSLAGKLGLSIAVAAAAIPSAVKACSYGPPLPPAEAQALIDRQHSQTFPLFKEFFEAEVLRVDGDNSEMRVTRVHRGQLRPGMILRGRGSYHSCMTRDLRVGERGYVLVTFGPAGPSYINEFMSEVSLQSLRRLGLLPED